MADNSKYTFLIIGGGYLVYTGSKLVSEVMKNHPSNENIFIAFGVFFAIFGLLIVCVNLRNVYKDMKGKKESDTIVEEIEFPEEITEPLFKKEKHVQMVKLGAEEAEHPFSGEDTVETGTMEECIEEDEMLEDDLDEEFSEELESDFDDEDTDDDELFEQKLERI